MLIYYIGKVAETWLSRFSWIALVVAIVAGIVTTLIIRHRAQREFANATGGSDSPSDGGRASDQSPELAEGATTSPAGPST